MDSPNIIQYILHIFRGVFLGLLYGLLLVAQTGQALTFFKSLYLQTLFLIIRMFMIAYLLYYLLQFNVTESILMFGCFMITFWIVITYRVYTNDRSQSC
jgi:ABC-type iron transport system FetAB permease component